MLDEPKFTDEQWALILELVEQERDELPSEIHHTGKTSVREELQHRLELVNPLLEHMRPPAMV
jgi:hypothetical protein